RFAVGPPHCWSCEMRSECPSGYLDTMTHRIITASGLRSIRAVIDCGAGHPWVWHRLAVVVSAPQHGFSGMARLCRSRLCQSRAGRTGAAHRGFCGRGDQIATSALLFKQDDTAERAARDQAARQLAQAEAQLANLKAAMKPTEVTQAEANLADARSTLARARADLQRDEALLKSGYATAQSVDQRRADYRSAE